MILIIIILVEIVAIFIILYYKRSTSPLIMSYNTEDEFSLSYLLVLCVEQDKMAILKYIDKYNPLIKEIMNNLLLIRCNIEIIDFIISLYVKTDNLLYRIADIQYFILNNLQLEYIYSYYIVLTQYIRNNNIYMKKLYYYIRSNCNVFIFRFLKKSYKYKNYNLCRQKMMFIYKNELTEEKTKLIDKRIMDFETCPVCLRDHLRENLTEKDACVYCCSVFCAECFANSMIKKCPHCSEVFVL